MTDEERLRLITDTIAEIRPAVQRDGGDITFAGIDGHRVLVHLTGRCLSCSLAGQTLGGIRRRLMDLLAEPVMVVPAPMPAG